MVYLMRLRGICIETFKAINDLNPAFISKMFSRNSKEYGLRDCIKMIKPKVRTELCVTNTFCYQGFKIWNEVPPDMTEASSITYIWSLMAKWNGPACCCALRTLCKLSRFKLNWPRSYWKKCSPFQSKKLFELFFLIFTWKRFGIFYRERQILSPISRCFL